VNPLSPFRILILRAAYLVIAVGLGLMIWPALLDFGRTWGHMQSVACVIFGSLSLLSVVGVFRPVHMLPLLYLELLWKSLWLVLIAIPMASAAPLDDNFEETRVACIVGIVLCLVALPWEVVVRRRARG